MRFFLFLGVFFIYTEKGTRDFIDKLPEAPRSLEQGDSGDVSSEQVDPKRDLSTISEPESVASTMSGSEKTRVTKYVDVDPEDPLADFDWRDDDAPYVPEHDDPLGDYLKEAEAMDPDELRNAEYNQHRAGPSGDLQNITRDDVNELRSMGIRVDIDNEKDGGMRITISTE